MLGTAALGDIVADPGVPVSDPASPTGQARADGHRWAARSRADALNAEIRTAGYRSPQRSGPASDADVSLPPDHPAAVLARPRTAGTWHARLTERAVNVAAARAGLPATASPIAEFVRALDVPRCVNAVADAASRARSLYEAWRSPRHAPTAVLSTRTIDLDRLTFAQAYLPDTGDHDDTGNRVPPSTRTALTTTVLTAAPPRTGR